MPTDSEPPFHDIDWDDELEKTPFATRAIARGALRVERWLIERAATAPLTLGLLQGFHRTMFAEVFPDFAGRLRGLAPQYIPYAVIFGNYRGEIYDRVPDACERLCVVVAQLIRDLDDLRTTAAESDFDEEALKVAAYTHCEIIRIRPFVNGNGRIARTCINYFAALRVLARSH